MQTALGRGKNRVCLCNVDRIDRVRESCNEIALLFATAQALASETTELRAWTAELIGQSRELLPELLALVDVQ
jgi:hypothetical protein